MVIGVAGLEVENSGALLTSQQEVAEYLKMHPSTLERFLRKYPFAKIGKPGKVNGRWRVYQSAVSTWWAYVERQECRHPDSRRMRPEEAPELVEIVGR